VGVPADVLNEDISAPESETERAPERQTTAFVLSQRKGELPVSSSPFAYDCDPPRT